MGSSRCGVTRIASGGIETRHGAAFAYDPFTQRNHDCKHGKICVIPGAQPTGIGCPELLIGSRASEPILPSTLVES
jgi:hypothetical protein